MAGAGTPVRDLGSARPSRRDRLWTFATAGVLVLASLGAWHALRRMHQEQGRRISEQVARSIASEISWELQDQYRVSRRLAQFWLRFGRQEHEEWKYDTGLFLDNNKLDAILWVDPAFADPTWSAVLGDPLIPAREGDAVRLQRSQDRSIREREEVSAGPFALTDGDQGYWVVIPLGKKGTGVLVSARRLHQVFTAIERDYPGLCALRVHSGPALVHQSRNTGCSPAPTVRTPVPVWAPEDRAWTIEMEPSPAIAGTENLAPHIVLAGGLLTAALLGTVMWTRGMTRSRERQLRRLNLGLESRVRARTAELGEAVGELQAFNYSVSHDLRSPLGAVVNFAGILAEDKGDLLDAEGREHVERIRSSATVALTMLDALLELSRAGRAEITSRRLDTRALVAEIWYEINGAQSNEGARLELGEVPACRADPTLLRLVLTNLLSNAVKFSAGREEPVIQVGGRREDGETILWVKDNGVGFDPVKSSRLFKIFSRLHEPSQFPGTGVGLAIVDRIVKRHGGRVWAESAPGRGASFFISLPGRVSS